MPIARRLLAAVLLLSLAAAAGAEDVPVVRLVAQPDDEPYGLEDGESVTPTPDRERLSIDRDGGVLFTGEVHNAEGVTVHVDGIFSAEAVPDFLRAVFVPGDPAPTRGGIIEEGWTVLDVQDARRSVQGDIVVQARIHNGILYLPAYLTDHATDQRTAVVELWPGFGICELEKLGADSVGGSFSINGGWLAFQGRYDDACENDGHAVFRRLEDSAAQELLVEDAPVPGRPGATWSGDFLLPLLNEDGDLLVFAELDLGKEVRGSLVCRDRASGTTEVVAETGVTLPDTLRTLARIAHWRHAPPLEEPGGLVRRVVYAGHASFTGDPWDPEATFHVFDTSYGTTPILSTDSSAASNTYFFEGDLNTGAAIEPADHGQVIVVGETTGGGLPVGAIGVWRYDPREAPLLKVPLVEGMPLETADGPGDVVSAIGTVAVNAEGRIAAEVMIGGSEAIVMEEPDSDLRGSFRVVVKQGDLVPARKGEVELVGIVGNWPTYPPLSGAGFDGRPSRFNENGEFVFRGRAVFSGGGVRSGVYAVSLGPPPPPKCDVTVRQKGANLSITNGGCGASILVYAGTNGEFQVSRGPETTINGEDEDWYGTATGSVKISMGSGDDQVVVTSVGPGTHLLKNLSIDMGPGEDYLGIGGTEIDGALGVAGSLTIRTGPGESDEVEILAVAVGRNFKLTGGDGKGVVLAEQLTVGGKSKVLIGDGKGSSLTFRDCLLGRAKIRGGADSDVIRLTGTTLGPKSKIDLGTGEEDDLWLGEVQAGGSLSISAKKSGFAGIGLSLVLVEDGDLKIQTGSGACDVAIEDSWINRRVVIGTRGNSDPLRANDVGLANVEIGRSLSIEGKGDFDIELSDGTRAAEGVAINLKDGGHHDVTISDLLIADGHLQIASSGAEFTGDIRTVRIDDGTLVVRTGKVEDRVDLAGCDVSGTVTVTTSSGNDVVTVNGMEVGGDLRLGGGTGDDQLDLGGESANAVQGETIADSFEGTPP